MNPFARGLNVIALQDKPHGTRARYVAGKCRCFECRRANSAYYHQRKAARARGEAGHIVSAEPARLHIKKLSRAGVGYKMVADAARVARSVVAGIKSGERSQARADTVRRILQVGIESRGDAALVSGASTWARIGKLKEEGFSKRALARALGYKSLAIQFRRQRVTVKTRARVERLFERLTT